MDTAMCLMEANQPVYPLDIVRQMRDQRAMLIQTSVSVGVSRGYTDYHQGRAIHMADSRIH